MRSMGFLCGRASERTRRGRREKGVSEANDYLSGSTSQRVFERECKRLPSGLPAFALRAMAGTASLVRVGSEVLARRSF